MIGHDNAIPNYVHAARASWLYLHEDPMQTPNQTPLSSDYRKHGCGNNKFYGSVRRSSAYRTVQRWRALQGMQAC
jgi:hypothetical protein